MLMNLSMALEGMRASRRAIFEISFSNRSWIQDQPTDEV
jgi:hypothetical protein